jgi:hypothetical protein
MFEWQTLDELNVSFKELKDEWDRIKSNFPKPKFIDQQLKKLESLLRSKKPGEQFFIEHQANTIYNLCKKLIKNGEPVSYNIISLSSTQSDQIQTFIENCDEMDDKTYWKELAHAYTMQDHKKLPHTQLKKLFVSDRKHRHLLMTEDEFMLLNQLPDILTIYRGGSPSEQKTGKYGVSWTLNKAVAQRFAETKSITTKKPMSIFEITVSKADIVAYFNERCEEEVIYIRRKKAC